MINNTQTSKQLIKTSSEREALVYNTDAADRFAEISEQDKLKYKIQYSANKNTFKEPITNFSIPQWDYKDYANELNTFRKGFDGLGTGPGWFYFKIFFHFDETFGLLGNILSPNKGNTASEYLKSRIPLFKYDNLSSRLVSLQKFVKYLSFINCNAPWFFDKIEGLDKAILSLNNFTKEKQISISCLEDAIDMRLTSLFHLYQYACFDEIQMKEIIPENLRKFNMTVILYHVPIKYFDTMIPSVNAKSLQGDSLLFSNRMSYKMFTFKGCEFNLESLGGIIPSSLDNAQPFNLGKSSIVINYDRVFTHLMNSWDQFMIGPDGFYYDKDYKIGSTDMDFQIRLQSMIDDNNLHGADSLLAGKALTILKPNIGLGNIYNFDVREYVKQTVKTNNPYIGNLYDIDIAQFYALTSDGKQLGVDKFNDNIINTFKFKNNIYSLWFKASDISDKPTSVEAISNNLETGIYGRNKPDEHIDNDYHNTLSKLSVVFMEENSLWDKLKRNANVLWDNISNIKLF